MRARDGSEGEVANTRTTCPGLPQLKHLRNVAPSWRGIVHSAETWPICTRNNVGAGCGYFDDQAARAVLASVLMLR